MNLSLFGLFSDHSASKEAEVIQEKTSYRLLHIAWAEYLRIAPCKETIHGCRMRDSSVPTWRALMAIQNHDGNLCSFNEEEIYYLEAIVKGPGIYQHVMDTLSNHNYTDEEIDGLFDLYHDLEDAVPHDILKNDKKGVIELLVDVVFQYHKEISAFAEKHKETLEKQIQKIEAKEKKKETS